MMMGSGLSGNATLALHQGLLLKQMQCLVSMSLQEHGWPAYLVCLLPNL